jgi:hypothetical protein
MEDRTDAQITFLGQDLFGRHAAVHPHAGDVDQRVGRHYTRFRANVRPAGKENQKLGRGRAFGAASIRVESAKFG